MKTIQIEIESAKRSISNAIAELKRLYNDNETSLREMFEIAEYAKLLDITDFTETITGH